MEEVIGEEEPDDVVSWVLYMHQDQDPSVHALLKHTGENLRDWRDNYEGVHPNWPTYVRTRLPNVLLELLCGLGKLSTDSSQFNVRAS